MSGLDDQRNLKITKIISNKMKTILQPQRDFRQLTSIGCSGTPAPTTVPSVVDGGDGGVVGGGPFIPPIS